MKITQSSLVQELVLLVHVRSVKFSPGMDGEAISFTGRGGERPKIYGAGQGEELPPPSQGDVLLQDLQLPHIAGQGGADPLVAVPHVGLVVAVSLLQDYPPPPQWHGT